MEDNTQYGAVIMKEVVAWGDIPLDVFILKELLKERGFKNEGNLYGKKSGNTVMAVLFNFSETSEPISPLCISVLYSSYRTHDYEFTLETVGDFETLDRIFIIPLEKRLFSEEAEKVGWTPEKYVFHHRDFHKSKYYGK